MSKMRYKQSTELGAKGCREWYLLIAMLRDERLIIPERYPWAFVAFESERSSMVKPK